MMKQEAKLNSSIFLGFWGKQKLFLPPLWGLRAAGESLPARGGPPAVLGVNQLRERLRETHSGLTLAKHLWQSIGLLSTALSYFSNQPGHFLF